MLDWSQFEGLFEQPPLLFVDGQRIELSEQHNVIFTANPTSYGDERHTPRLFREHGNAVYFQPMPACYIFQRLLIPLFAHTDIVDSQIKSLCEPALAIYQFLTIHSPDRILISPRGIQMSA